MPRAVYLALNERKASRPRSKRPSPRSPAPVHPPATASKRSGTRARRSAGPLWTSTAISPDVGGKSSPRPLSLRLPLSPFPSPGLKALEAAPPVPGMPSAPGPREWGLLARRTAQLPRAPRAASDVHQEAQANPPRPPDVSNCVVSGPSHGPGRQGSGQQAGGGAGGGPSAAIRLCPGCTLTLGL